MGKRKSYIWRQNPPYKFDEEKKCWVFSHGVQVIKTKSWVELPSPPKPSGIQISVVIINWNRPLNVVKSCIESVLNQDFPPENFEVILVDDASDISPKIVCLKILREYPDHNFRAYLLDRTRTWGSAHGYNVGLKRAVGWIVMTLQSEAILDEKLTPHTEEPRDLNDGYLRQPVLEGTWRHHNVRDKLALHPRVLQVTREKGIGGKTFFPTDLGMSIRKKYVEDVYGFVENSMGDCAIDYFLNLTRRFGIQFTEDVNMQVVHRDYLVPEKCYGPFVKVRPASTLWLLFSGLYADWPERWGELTENEEKNVIRSQKDD